MTSTEIQTQSTRPSEELQEELDGIEEKETNFDENCTTAEPSGVTKMSSLTSSPAKGTLTPSSATLLGTVQRRLSFANTNIAEGKMYILYSFLMMIFIILH